MKTRTAVFDAPRSISILEHELPSPGPNQVLIKVKACALCTWEQRFYKGTAPESYPFCGGHEVSGEIVSLGEKANCQAAVGDAVSVAIMTRCGACESCRRGMDNFCENDNGGSPSDLPWGPAGLSDHILVEDYQVYAAGNQRDFAELALAEPVACVLRSVSTPPLLLADNVMVQGAGIMGLLHVLLLQQRGMRIIVSEPDLARREKALELGAHVVLDPLAPGFEQEVLSFTKGRGLNAAFFTAGGVPAVEQAVPLLSKGGWLCLYGSIHPKGLAQLDPNLIHYKELVVTGTFSHTKHSFHQAVALLSSGLLDVSPFITKRLPFPMVSEGFEMAIQPGTYRVVMTFEDGAAG
jgi:threonine dehydrogenase-like Zn-dependent dehydrogenase